MLGARSQLLRHIGQALGVSSLGYLVLVSSFYVGGLRSTHAVDRLGPRGCILVLECQAFVPGTRALLNMVGSIGFLVGRCCLCSCTPRVWGSCQIFVHLEYLEGQLVQWPICKLVNKFFFEVGLIILFIYKISS